VNADRLKGVGIWSLGLRRGDVAAAAAAASVIEQLGYSAIWFPGSSGGDVFDRARALVQATDQIAVATGVVNVWAHAPEEVAAQHQLLRRESSGRFVLGMGCSHAPLVARMGLEYASPLTRMSEFLDDLDGLGVPASERILAALGPRMLALAAERSIGAHPFNVTPDHTARARATMGSDAVLAPEQKVLFERDGAKARALARHALAAHLTLPNYVRNLIRLGYTNDDVADGGSDKLIDDLVAWGDEETIAGRVRDHVAAGADHVCIQVVTTRPDELPLDTWRLLAPFVTEQRG
jgi:probable F420-dependent oxidoreductase